MKFVAALLALAVMVAPALANAQDAGAPKAATRVLVRARSDDASLNTRLQTALEAELKKVPGYVIDERAPLGQVLVYANTTSMTARTPRV